MRSESWAVQVKKRKIALRSLVVRLARPSGEKYVGDWLIVR